MAKNVGIGAQLRAAVARVLAAFASLFHGAERWATGGPRATLALAMVVALAVVSIIGVVREARAMGSWASAHLVGSSPHGGVAAAKPAGKRGGEPVAKPATKPGGEPVAKPAEKPSGGPAGKPVGKPEGPGRGGEGVTAPPAAPR